MKNKLFIRTFLIAFMLSLVFWAGATKPTISPIPLPYNIIWNSPSKDALDSMPLSGKKGAGANVWVQDGSIWLYLAHNGAYDEQGRLLKLGCVRLTPKEIALGGVGFHQELDLATGSIIVQQGDFKAMIWFAGETLIFESFSGKPHTLNVAFGTWRNQQRNGVIQDMGGAKGNYSPDQVKADNEGFVWFHRNADFPKDVLSMAKAQGIPEIEVYDVTTKRVFGGAIAVKGGISNVLITPVKWQFWEGKAWTGGTSANKNHVITMRLGGTINGDPRQWQNEAKSMLSAKVRQQAKIREKNKWNDFWSRSHVFVNMKNGDEDPGFLLGRNYQLFRYMLACNRDGELPLLFNGGIFTVDKFSDRITGNNNNNFDLIPEGSVITPDYRRWMGVHFMSQNQRWLGWPTLANGDSDLLSPSLAFYRDRSIVAAARAKTNGAEGVVYPEPLDMWGLCCVSPGSDGLCKRKNLDYHFSMMLEHAWMALQAHDQLGISITDDLPWIEGTVLFYDIYYRNETKKRTGEELDKDGKLLIYPGSGLEYAGDATNPIDAVCGLQRVTAGLAQRMGC